MRNAFPHKGSCTLYRVVNSVPVCILVDRQLQRIGSDVRQFNCRSWFDPCTGVEFKLPRPLDWSLRPQVCGPLSESPCLAAGPSPDTPGRRASSIPLRAPVGGRDFSCMFWRFRVLIMT